MQPYEIKWDGAEAGEPSVDPSKEGKAAASYPNGDKYEGTYANGKRDGKGAYTWKAPALAEGEEEQKPGTVYEGDFKSGMKHGKGVLKCEDGSEYRGDFKDGVKSGQGVYYYANGDSYLGEWANDVRHGKGTYSFAKCKSIYSGNWENGSLKKGFWKLADGTTQVMKN